MGITSSLSTDKKVFINPKKLQDYEINSNIQINEITKKVLITLSRYTDSRKFFVISNGMDENFIFKSIMMDIYRKVIDVNDYKVILKSVIILNHDIKTQCDLIFYYTEHKNQTKIKYSKPHKVSKSLGRGKYPIKLYELKEYSTQKFYLKFGGFEKIMKRIYEESKLKVLYDPKITTFASKSSFLKLYCTNFDSFLKYFEDKDKEGKELYCKSILEDEVGLTCNRITPFYFKDDKNVLYLQTYVYVRFKKFCEDRIFNKLKYCDLEDVTLEIYTAKNKSLNTNSIFFDSKKKIMADKITEKSQMKIEIKYYLVKKSSVTKRKTFKFLDDNKKKNSRDVIKGKY